MRSLLGALVIAAALSACGGEDPAPAPTPDPPAQTTPPAQTEQAAPDQIALALPERAATTPYPAVASPDLEKTLEVLGAVVDYGAGDPENPWAISHGVLARGEGFTLRDGSVAVDHLFSTWGVEQEIGGRTLVGFPRSRGEVRIEPHTDLILKNLTEVGLSPDRVVQVADHEHEIEDLWRHSLATTWLKRDGSSSFDSPNDMPWGMQGLTAWAPAGLRWTAWEGSSMGMDDLTKLVVHVLNSESQFMLRAMVEGADFQKRGQGVFKYTCGGAHLLQGAAHAVARGFGGSAEAAKIQAQGRLLFYRFPREIAIYEQVMAAHPDQRLILLAQQLKFTGHWLESVHKMAAAGQLTADAADQIVMAEAVGVLIETTRELKALGALDNLDEVRAKNEQLYLDLVGDSAHAVRGVELALGRGVYRY